MSSAKITRSLASKDPLSSLVRDHLEQKKELFKAVNNLVNQLHHTQMLLEENKSKEALLTVEQLVQYGENIARQF